MFKTFLRLPESLLKSLWPLKMHFSSAAHDLRPVWKCIICYSSHLLLLMSSWANLLLSKNLKAVEISLSIKLLPLLRNLKRIYFGETHLGWKICDSLFIQRRGKYDPSWISSKHSCHRTSLMHWKDKESEHFNFRFHVCSVSFTLSLFAEG